MIKNKKIESKHEKWINKIVQIRNVLTLPISLRSSKGVFGLASRKADKEKQISLEVDRKSVV